MNEATVYRYIAGRLDRMTDEQLDAVRRDCLFICDKVMSRQQTGEEFEGFDEDLEWRLDEHLKNDPHEFARRRAVLAEERPLRKKRDPDDFLEEACAKRDEAEDRWDAIRDKIAKAQFPECRSWRVLDEKLMSCAELPNGSGLRVAELIAHAELYAGAEHLGIIWHAIQNAHLRIQKIDTLASFMTWLSHPMAAAADPLEAA
jgi:hypothetical protein